MSEHDEQVKLFQWARLSEGRWPELALLFAIPNGGKRHVAVARKLKAEGVKAGVPDICLPVSRGRYHGLFIELKHGKNRTQTNQRRWLEDLGMEGYCARVAFEFEGAKQLLEDYLAGVLPVGPAVLREVLRVAL